LTLPVVKFIEPPVTGRDCEAASRSFDELNQAIWIKK
jgi:hypothetical protein